MSHYSPKQLSDLWVDGEEALACMQHICANQMDVEIGQIVYTQWLNEDAGIEADVTVTRTAEQTFMVGACASERRDATWLHRHAEQFNCSVRQDQETTIIGVMGPKSTALLARLLNGSEAIEQLAIINHNNINLLKLTCAPIMAMLANVVTNCICHASMR